jgi:hypothetical protein
MFCSSCGKSIPDSARFCPECGFSTTPSQVGASRGAAAVASPSAPAAVVIAPPQLAPHAAPVYAAPTYPSAPGIHSAVGTRDQTRGSGLIYPRNPPLSPHLAWLTLLIPGLPQLIFGQVGKGIVIFIVACVLLPTGIGPLLVALVALIDAYLVGRALQSGKAISKWQFFPT